MSISLPWRQWACIVQHVWGLEISKYIHALWSTLCSNLGYFVRDYHFPKDFTLSWRYSVPLVVLSTSLFVPLIITSTTIPKLKTSDLSDASPWKYSSGWNPLFQQEITVKIYIAISMKTTISRDKAISPKVLILGERVKLCAWSELIDFVTYFGASSLICRILFSSV